MKTVHEMSDELNAAYAGLSDLLYLQEQVETGLLSAQTDLSNARSRALLENDPAELGKNESIRDAKLAEITCRERYAVQELEAKRVSVRFRVEVARLRVDHARADLRLLEVQAGLSVSRLADGSPALTRNVAA